MYLNMEDKEINHEILKQIEINVNDELKRALDKFGIKDSAGFKNIIAIKDYTKQTRDLFRDLQKENELYKNQIKQQNLVLEQLKTQMQQLQIKVYQNNATG